MSWRRRNHLWPIVGRAKLAGLTLGAGVTVATPCTASLAVSFWIADKSPEEVAS